MAWSLVSLGRSELAGLGALASSTTARAWAPQSQQLSYRLACFGLVPFRLLGCLVAWLLSCLVGWLVDWLVAWLVGCLVAQLLSWLAG